MNRFEPNLRIPGPTSLPDAVREAGTRQMVNHRGPEFAALQNGVIERLKKAYRTENDVLILTAAGTGGLESAIVNFLSPGDRVLAVTIGAFGDRFAKIATVYGADVTKLAFDWGSAADPARVREALAAGGPWKAVLMTQNETSTAVTNPIELLAATVKEVAPDALIVVDAISGLGAVPFETDGWGLDVVVSGSQKAWMVPPGLSFVSVSPRAWDAAVVAKMPKFYFDLAAHKSSAEAGQTPWTPAVSVMFQLDVALDLMEQEGLQEIWRRHAAVGAAVRAGLTALSFKLLADPAFASDTVTGAWIPDDLDWKAFNGKLRKLGLIVAGGQGNLKGKIFRIGHLGHVTVPNILNAMAVLEQTLIELGRPVRPGVAVGAAQVAALESLGVAVAEGITR
ncbi:MAG: pyridoxal-phosphate-dependent aminotransferase family protein [Candidatus Limnocylindrales bacterium]